MPAGEVGLSGECQELLGESYSSLERGEPRIEPEGAVFHGFNYSSTTQQSCRHFCGSAKKEEEKEWFLSSLLASHKQSQRESQLEVAHSSNAFLPTCD